MKAAVALLTGLLAGCATTQDIASQPDMEVCRSYGVFRTGILLATAPAYRDEMIRRQLLSDEEWMLVERKELRIGMSQCAMYASWGRPDRENRSVGSYGVHIQHIFNTGYRYIRPTYIYTQNGKVRSWQD